MTKSMLLDTSKCIGCRACQVACKQWNQLPAEKTVFTGEYENPPHFSPVTWTKISFNEYEEDGHLHWFFSKHGCMHCTDAACMKVCPAGAIYRTDYGTVAIDTNKCIGCNYCVANCTYNVMGFDQVAHVARKCTFCLDRISNGLIPACVKTCPTGALAYGDRADMVRKAEQRLVKLKEAGNEGANIYGLDELDGLGVIYILEDRPSKYGLLENPRVSTAAHIWSYIFKPVRVLVVAAMAFALWFNRKESKGENLPK
ncbi:MAG: 4Fe-4S dicluster domain-containing protein [Firmicutes bacterium]|nr:4Fe-4S dicluster domain-containing protein [Bacillota bacterium]